MSIVQADRSSQELNLGLCGLLLSKPVVQETGVGSHRHLRLSLTATAPALLDLLEDTRRVITFHSPGPGRARVRRINALEATSPPPDAPSLAGNALHAWPRPQRERPHPWRPVLLKDGCSNGTCRRTG